ncbi:MAG: hypothetical protein ACM32G_01665, partial [Betaproteobacteria bacterium]
MPFRSTVAAYCKTAKSKNQRLLAARVLAPLAVILLTMAAWAGEQSSGSAGPTLEGKRPVGTVELSEVQAAYIGSGTTGNGLLHFRGKTYPFTVSGLGAGGIGLSKIEAAGDVYGLENV